MGRSRVTDQLSSEAQAVLLACFRERLPASLIALRIKAETGADVAERTISRRKAEWDAEQLRRQRAREQMENYVAAMKASDATVTEMVQALAFEALLANPGELMTTPVELQKLEIAAHRNRIQEARLDIQRRAVALDESKFELMRQREEKAIAAANDLKDKVERGVSLTPADIERIRGIYGLS